MEKSKPHYNLDEIKASFSDPDNLGTMTGSARNGIRALKSSDEDVANVVQSLSMREFHKSMTSFVTIRFGKMFICRCIKESSFT